MKKEYLKPDAEYIAFYSDKDIAAVLPLDENVLDGRVSNKDNTEGWE